MGTIRFVPGDERRFLTIAQLAEENAQAREALADAPPSELLQTTCFHHDGSADEPQLLEVEFPPNQEVPPHAHQEDEILYIVRGEIHFGNRVLGPGSSVFIPRMTLYSFKAGPDGLVWVNFRPRKPVGATIPKEKFMAMRAAEKV
jgi:quercetin dioxygenase-like cupin family protein